MTATSDAEPVPSGGAPLEIAYLASIYPRAVDTAVRNEVTALRAMGHRVHTFSIRKADDAQMVTDFHRSERAATTYLYSDHRFETPLAALALALGAPRRFAAGLALAWRTAAPGLRALVWQAAYFLEACFLARALRERSVEHLHCHIGENSASVAMLASALSGVPFSMTIHGPYIFRAPERWALGEKIVRSAFTVCITEFTKSQCMIYAPVEHWPKLRVVHCGPDPAFLAQEPSPVAADAKRLVWVGRVCEEKAVPILLEAARRVASDGLDFELLLIGDGPLREASERRIRDAGLADRVRITGWMNSQQIVEQMATARGMVLPSFAEGLPAVLMEAMAMARPCISTYIAGIPELVEPGRNGWLVPASDVDALADAMRALLSASVDELRALGAAGRAAVLARHDPSVEAAKLAALIAGSARGAR
ncbi:MAG: glycosyltransferase family 4 protein [Myxococcota bacterium]